MMPTFDLSSICTVIICYNTHAYRDEYSVLKQTLLSSLSFLLSNRLLFGLSNANIKEISLFANKGSCVLLFLKQCLVIPNEISRHQTYVCMYVCTYVRTYKRTFYIKNKKRTQAEKACWVFGVVSHKQRRITRQPMSSIFLSERLQFPSRIGSKLNSLYKVSTN
jgi:hypothetical protein